MPALPESVAANDCAPAPKLKAPFTYFGGKSRVAGEIWRRFGDVPNYVEPFFGSGAALLGRPHPGRIETVNDLDHFVANFWRSVKSDPGEVARLADRPVIEADLHARHWWLISEGKARIARIEGDPLFFDPLVAAWWMWGMACSIGGSWCSGAGPWRAADGMLARKQGAEAGIRRKLPMLGGGGNGIHGGRHLAGGGREAFIRGWIAALSNRLREVRVACGDWTRVVSPAVTTKNGLTAVLLDPPYGNGANCGRVYSQNDGAVAAAAREWAIANGGNPKLRICLCGYDGEHAMPPDWSEHAWKTGGGYGVQGDGRGRVNASRERLWFSPACLDP